MSTLNQNEGKLISFAIPCYNSAAYMRNCIDHLLASQAEDIEIIIVDDGSQKDNTLEIAKEYEEKYPLICKAVHQENGGHGAAVMTGIHNAAGHYFKVVDSDDWLDTDELKKVLETLREISRGVDMVVCNYVYDKVGVENKKVIRYKGSIPEGRVVTWEETGHFRKGEYMLMHSLIYRTALLRECGLELPHHTFYVDNLFAYVPMASVRYLYYINSDLYHYFIGRDDQSVQETVMISRMDQQMRVNKMMVEQVDLDKVSNAKQRKYLYNYLEIITGVSCILTEVSGDAEKKKMRDELWEFIKEKKPALYKKLRWGLIGFLSNPKSKAGHTVSVEGYHILNKIFNFN